MFEFKLWLEKQDFFGNAKKELRDAIVKILEPNKGNVPDVTSTRIGEFGSDEDITSRHGKYIINLFNQNPQIWQLMSKAFPGEEETLKNRVTQWLQESQPRDQIADLFNVIGIGDEPIIQHEKPKPPQQQPQQPPAATNQQAPGLPNPAPMPEVTS